MWEQNPSLICEPAKFTFYKQNAKDKNHGITPIVILEVNKIKGIEKK